MKNFSNIEICACLGIVIRAGADRDNFTALDDLWDTIDGRPFYKATTALQRFKFFLRSVRFDNYRTRATRLANDRMAAISELWTPFLQNLRAHYVPKACLTVDEQLLGYRGQIPGRTYIPSKPRKYRLENFWLCEAASGFALNAKLYIGRENNSVSASKSWMRCRHGTLCPFLQNESGGDVRQFLYLTLVGMSLASKWPDNTWNNVESPA